MNNLKSIFKKGLALLIADFFGLMVGILNGFFLPTVFSLDGYAIFRTFTLYATYATIFSFGLSDGMYLIYGGKEERQINPARTKAYCFFLIKMQAVVFLFLFLLSWLVLKDEAFVYFSLFVTPLQIIHFFRLYFRAVGEFGKYSKLQIALVIFELLNTLLIVFYVKSDQPNFFIVVKILNHIVIALLVTMIFLWKQRDIKAERLKAKQVMELVRPGIVVLSADLIAAIIFSLDRWFVMALFSKEDFAYYAFAVSIFTLFFTCILSITSIFYPTISKRLGDSEYLKHLKNYTIILSSCFPVSYFFIKFIVFHFLPAYINGLSILWILFLAIPFVGVIHVVYINLYKATGSVRTYISRMVIVLALSFVLYITAFLLWRTLQTIALATLLTFVLWYIFSSNDFKQTQTGKKSMVYLLINLSVFILMQWVSLNWFLSFMLYLILIMTNTIVFFKNELIVLFMITKENLHYKG